jgi:hypothetical protein
MTLHGKIKLMVQMSLKQPIGYIGDIAHVDLAHEPILNFGLHNSFLGKVTFGFNISHKKRTLERNKVTKMRVFPLKVMVFS